MRRVRFVPSPNRDARPPGARVELVVLHAISLPPGVFCADTVCRFFRNEWRPGDPELADIAAMRVSAHFLVDREGGIVQFVPVDERAWHAGASSWRGRPQCNDFSVGIELLGDARTPFAEAQYAAAGALVRALWRRFGLDARAQVVGHADIAPGRKWDPGPMWDWARFWRAFGDGEWVPEPIR